MDNAVVSELISASFERVAEKVDDLSASVYGRYFAADPAAAGLMAHMDDLTRGRMLNEVLRLVMAWDPAGDAAYLDFEVRNHQYAYQVDGRMYRELLVALRDTVAEILGETFEPERAAWDARVAELLAEIEKRAA